MAWILGLVMGVRSRLRVPPHSAKFDDENNSNSKRFAECRVNDRFLSSKPSPGVLPISLSSPKKDALALLVPWVFLAPLMHSQTLGVFKSLYRVLYG